MNRFLRGIGELDADGWDLGGFEGVCGGEMMYVCGC